MSSDLPFSFEGTAAAATVVVEVLCFRTFEASTTASIELIARLSNAIGLDDEDAEVCVTDDWSPHIFFFTPDIEFL